MDLPIFVMNKRVLNSIAMTSTQSSEVVDIAEVGGYCVHAIWSGSPVGNILIEGSNDSSNFSAVVTQAAGGSSGQLLYNAERQHYRYLRITYSFTSGTGTLNCYVSAKRI